MNDLSKTAMGPINYLSDVLLENYCLTVEVS